MLATTQVFTGSRTIPGYTPKVVLAPLQIDGIKELARGRLHEAMGPASFSLGLCAGASAVGPIFWTGLHRDVAGLRARGIAKFFDPNRLIQCVAANRKETLWCGEEALRCKGAGLVILQMNTGPDLFESRRLQIASQIGGGLGIVLIGKRAQSSAAQTRWYCTSHPHLPGHWVWDLTKNKSGRLGHWSVCWSEQEAGKHATPKPDDLIDRRRAKNPARGFAKTTACSPLTAAAARPLETA